MQVYSIQGITVLLNFMRFKIWLFLLALITLSISLFTVNVSAVYADPPDDTYGYYIFEKDLDGSIIPTNQVKVYYYIKWLVAGGVYYRALNEQPQTFEDLASRIDLIRDYAKENTSFANNGEDCEPILQNEDSDPTQNALEAEVVYLYKCSEPIREVNIVNNLSNDIFPSSNNYITFQIGEDALKKVQLGDKNREISFNYDEMKANPQKDDNYLELTKEGSGNIKFTNSESSTNNKVLSPRENTFVGGIVADLLNQTRKATDQSPLLLMGIVFLLGLLHTLEAGHSKAVLASSMLHKGMNFKRGMIYVFVFTATHLGDIMLVGVLFLVLNNFYDLFANFSYIEKFAGFAVFFMALYMLIRSLTDLAKHKLKTTNNHNHDHPHEHTHSDHDHHHDSISEHGHSHNEDILTSDSISFKEQVVMGILTGIAPCVFGWTIFMLVISTGKIWLIFPVILSFGFGIFIALTIVAGLISKVKNSTYGRLNILAELSPIISALFLLIYALFLIT